MKRRIPFFLIGLAVALLFESRAAAESPFVVDVWNTANRLPENSVIAVIQTRDGWLWLGTLNGLARFDGNSFTPFNVNNTPGLPGNGVIFLFEDSRTNLWVGTDNAGLCLLKNGVVKNFDLGGAGGKIRFADEDETGTVWFCTADGKFFSARDGKLDLRPAKFPVQLFYRVFYLRVPGKDGAVWQLQNGRVEKLRDEKPEKDFGALPWQNSPVTALYRIPDGSFVQIPFDANITAACADRDGGLVVGTRGSGVYWLDASGVWRHISTDDGLSHGIVLSLCFDTGGNLWVGTDGGGLDRVKRKLFVAPAGLSAGVAQSAAEDAPGGLWTAFNSRGLTYWLTNSVQNYGIGRGSNAWSVLVDSRRRVWAGTRDEGLFHFESAGFQPVVAAQKIGPQIFALFQSRDGKIWAGGQNGLGCFDGRVWNFFSTTDGLPPNAIRAIAEETNSNLFIGTDGGGLFSLHDGTISSVNAPVKDISCLLVDRDDVLWAGTSGHGLARLAQGRWTIFTADDGLAGDDIGYLIEDDWGNLWAGSYEGLMRIEKKSLADFAAGAAKKIPCRVFLTRECSAGAQPAALRARDGKFWFPTIEGLISVNPADLKPDTNPPPVVIESVLVDDVPQKMSGTAQPGTVTLTPENEQLEIHYTALDFSAPELVRFKCWLEGREAKPLDVGGERVARYPKLPPGNYRFHVTACNEDGIWNETGGVLAITVQPHFWQTTGFRAAAIIFLLGIIIAVVRFISTQKLKRQLQRLKQKELLEHERARIARDLHDQLGANLTQVTLLGEMAEADKHLPDEIEAHAQQICSTARETTRSLDEIVWAVNPSNDTLEGLMNYACKYAQDYFALAGVRYRVDVPAQLPAAVIPPEVRHNVFLAFKEAVHNVVKHAEASEARVRLRLEPEKFILSVEDNGRGLGDLSGKNLRNGLNNMRKRMSDIRGEFEIAPGANGGTIVRLTVPIT